MLLLHVSRRRQARLGDTSTQLRWNIKPCSLARRTLPLTTLSSMADQPALRPDGQLRDASEITWYNDSDDAHPIQPTSRMQEGASLLFCITSGEY